MAGRAGACLSSFPGRFSIFRMILFLLYHTLPMISISFRSSKQAKNSSDFGEKWVDSSPKRPSNASLSPARKDIRFRAAAGDRCAAGETPPALSPAGPLSMPHIRYTEHGILFSGRDGAEPMKEPERAAAAKGRNICSGRRPAGIFDEREGFGWVLKTIPGAACSG